MYNEFTHSHHSQCSGRTKEMVPPVGESVACLAEVAIGAVARWRTSTTIAAAVPTAVEWTRYLTCREEER